jgi:hypothetical protein
MLTPSIVYNYSFILAMSSIAEWGSLANPGVLYFSECATAPLVVRNELTAGARCVIPVVQPLPTGGM